jgi:hypothetical protein
VQQDDVLVVVETEALGGAWLAAMRRGDFAAAWQISDRALAAQRAAGPCFDRPRHEQWVWDGRPLAGQRVLVRCYHGLGDTIQFARLLPTLAQIAQSVTVWAQPALIPLLQTLPARLHFLPLHDGTPEVDYDVDVESMELAHALRISLETLPRDVPYLHVPPEPRLSPDFSVGLLARAGGWDTRRSVPTAQLSELARLPGVHAVSLQLDEPIPGARDWSTPDLCTLARRVQALDLVITVDTMLAHLAGALAVPTWVLLPAEADWRWMTDRDDSPWYPTLRLFRQPAPGDWSSVLAAVSDALREARA